MVSRDIYGSGAVGGTLPVIAGDGEGAGPGAGSSPHSRGHQRTFSHGQIVEGGRGGLHKGGHRRAHSKTDFILPAGHEEREREKEERKIGKNVPGAGAGAGAVGTASSCKGHSRQASRTESVYTIRQSKRSMLQRLMFWKKRPEEGRTRLVYPNPCVSPEEPSPNTIYPDNSICTTKYTLLSFLPKNLFEQFHRFANLYFLFIVLLNFVPAVNAFGKEVAMLPLVFVLGITAVKDAFEDRRRYLSDRRVNYSTCRVFSRTQERYVKTLWKDVRVGDLIHLSCNEVIPADLVVLASSDSYGLCFVESSNLDGESNLKQRQCVRGLGMDDRFEASKFDHVLEVGAPSTKIYHFTGSIPLRSGERVPLTKDNLLLRDCTLRNTDFIEGIVVYAGLETKTMLNNGGTRYKRSRLERRMNIEVLWCVAILLVMCLVSATGSGIWQNVYEANATEGMVPFIPQQSPDVSPSDLKLANNSIWVGFISFWTFIIIYQVIIPISLYVTIEVIKLMQVYHIHQDIDFKDKKSGKTIECRALNIPEELGQVEYIFTDKTGTLTENNMVFQRCSINGIDYSHQPVIGTIDSQMSDVRDTFAINPDLLERVSQLEPPPIHIPPKPIAPVCPPRLHMPQSVLGRLRDMSDKRRTDNRQTNETRADEMLKDFFFTLAACNTVVVAKHPHRDQMNASGMIVPSESANASACESNLTHPPSSLSLSWAPTRVLRSVLTFSRPLSPIASSPCSTPPQTPQNTPHHAPHTHPKTYPKTHHTQDSSPQYAAGLEVLNHSYVQGSNDTQSSVSHTIPEQSSRSTVTHPLANHGLQSISTHPLSQSAVTLPQTSQSTQSSTHPPTSHSNQPSTTHPFIALNQSSSGSSSPVPSVSITLNPLGSSLVASESDVSLEIQNSSLTSPERPSVLAGLKPDHMYGPGTPGSSSRSVTPSPMDLKPIYEAESPDELALVDAAHKYGFRLLRRSLHNILVSVPGYGLCEYKVLHVLPFDSSRKRMSIIVCHPHTQEKILYCKGADSAILDRLVRPSDEACHIHILRTRHHLHTYSKLGLRILCMAKRVLSLSDYEEWVAKHKEAENALSNREHRLQDSYSRIEKDFTLIGATGIEDRLQEGVPETILAMRGAGIVVWVLTGDKQETAVNIAYSCALFTSEMEIMKINARTKDQAEQTIHFYLRQIQEQQEQEWRQEQERRTSGVGQGTTERSSSGRSNGYSNASSVSSQARRGLVIDGRTLVYILDQRANLKNIFLELASQCGAVLCCRATPLQKSLIVRSAKDALKVLTLAVGDGANDVSMIQTADVGVGISGLEGRQAVMASDFAIARFRHLEKLLLVHGHWCYHRLATIILYFFYKNASFVFLLLCYQVYAGFSGSSMIDQMYLMVFNLLFTSVPPIFLGIYDQDAPAEILLSQPHLYSQGREGRSYQPRLFWLNILDAAYQAIVLFFFAAVFHQDSITGMYEFGMTVTHACLVTQLLHIGIESKSWTIIQVSGIGLSIGVYYIFGLLYTATCPACLGSPSQYGELIHSLTSPLQWLTVLLTSIMAVLPRLVVRSLQCSLSPDEVTAAVLASCRPSVRLCDRLEAWWRARCKKPPSLPSHSPTAFRCGAAQGQVDDDDGDAFSSLVTNSTILTSAPENETEA